MRALRSTPSRASSPKSQARKTTAARGAAAAHVAPAPAADKEERDAKPFVKWAGGKWSLAPQIAKLLPADLAKRTYREPFLGGGALFFWLEARGAAKRFILSDALEDLVATYQVVRDRTDGLVTALERLREAHSPEHYYQVRERFNERTGGAVERAAWLIYLNKTCYNGLFRTNRSGLFNVPIGRFVRPRIVDEPRLYAASRALKAAEISCSRFQELRKTAQAGDVIYLDPPYVPMSKTSNFAAYSGGAFGLDLQEELANLYRELDRRGCKLALSNSDTDDVQHLYKGFDVTKVTAARNISAQGATRGTVTEVLVRNYR